MDAEQELKAKLAAAMLPILLAGDRRSGGKNFSAFARQALKLAEVILSELKRGKK